MNARQPIRIVPSAPARPAAAVRRMSLHALLLAPHRLAFFAGTLVLLLVSLESLNYN